MMVKQYYLVLSYEIANRFKTHLRNMGVKYNAGDVGGHQFIQFSCEDNDIMDIQVALDESKVFCWANKILQRSK